MLDRPLAQFKNLRVEFQTKDGPVVGVEDISFEVSAGETVCVVGESGSGKSTLARCIIRLMDSNSGQILIEGVDLTRLGRAAMRPRTYWVSWNSDKAFPN